MSEFLPFYSLSDDEYAGLKSENPIRFEPLYFEPEEYNALNYMNMTSNLTTSSTLLEVKWCV